MNDGNEIVEKREKLNVWTAIWLKPRETVRYAIDYKPMNFAIILVLVSGIFDLLTQAAQNDLGDKISIAWIIGLAIVLGPIIGLIGWWISAGISMFVGSWFGGTGTFKDLKMAIAISYIPLLLGGVLWIPDLLILGEAPFMEEVDISVGPTIWFFVSGFISFVLGIWSFIISVKAVAEAHSFSAWRGLWTVLIPGVLIVIVLFIFVLPFTFFFY